MTILAVIGDATTTTCVAFAATWPLDDETLVFEADPSGGSLAAWLDTPATPTLATVVATIGTTGGSVVATVASMTHASAAGIRFVPAPIRAVPAHRAIDEATATVVPALAGSPTIVLADLGRGVEAAPIVRWASTVVVVHRQSGRSAAAESVRLERLVERTEQMLLHDADVVVAVIGDDPFDPIEILALVESSVGGRVAGHVVLADDPLSAAVICGRTGVSAKRLRRLPLMRSAAAATSRLQVTLRDPVG